MLLSCILIYFLIQAALTDRAGAEEWTDQAVFRSDRRGKNSTKLVEPPLRTEGRYILDAKGERIKLISVNWFGASDVMFVPMGLDMRHRTEIAHTIRAMGFNSIRLPYSDQMVIENPVVDPVHLGANLDLLDGYEELQTTIGLSGPRALDVYKACVEALTDAGLAVIVNNHITNAHWCDGKNLCDASWQNDHLRPFCSIRQTTESWIENWETIMKPFIDNNLVIGADLRNEPRGLWGMMSWDGFATASERASEALLKLQPNWLMFVEGIASANDCSGARTRPVKLSIPNRVVYSSHVYAWSGWSTTVPYRKRNYASFRSDMERNWGYLLRNDIAPVWVGEFGAPNNISIGDNHYWKHLMKYLDETDADWGYWALNPHKPGDFSGISYGLLENDWQTVIEDLRIRDLRKIMGSLV